MKKFLWGILFAAYLPLANMLLLFIAERTMLIEQKMFISIGIAFLGAILFRMPRIIKLFRTKGRLKIDRLNLILGILFLFISMSSLWVYTIFASLPLSFFMQSLSYSCFLEAIGGFMAGLLIVDSVKKEEGT